MNIFYKIINPRNFLKIILNPRLTSIRLIYVLKRFLYDIIFVFNKKKYKYKIIFIAGMPMSATTKIKNMCGRIDGYFTRQTPMPDNISLKQDILDSAFSNCPSWSYTLFKTHLNPWEENIKIIKRNNVKKVIVSYRDLRDIVVARYYRLLNFPKKPHEPHYRERDKQYNNINKTDAINDCIEVVSNNYIKWILGWLDVAKKEKDFVLLCKFENLITDPKNEFKKILNFYEINLKNSTIENIVKATEGKKSMKVNIGEAKILPWAISSNFRSGKIGNWKEEFDSTNIAKFKEMAGQSLITLKYEKDLNW